MLPTHRLHSPLLRAAHDASRTLAPTGRIPRVVTSLATPLRQPHAFFRHSSLQKRAVLQRLHLKRRRVSKSGSLKHQVQVRRPYLNLAPAARSACSAPYLHQFAALGAPLLLAWRRSVVVISLFEKSVGLVVTQLRRNTPPSHASKRRKPIP